MSEITPDGSPVAFYRRLPATASRSADVVRVTVARAGDVVLRVIVESNEADADAFRPIAEQVLGTLSFD